MSPIESSVSGFAERSAALLRAHRARPGLWRRGLRASWLLRWLGSQLFAARWGPPVAPPIPDPSPGECTITFLGHASVLVRYAGARLLFDPCFATSIRSMRRRRPAVLPAGTIEDLDAVLVSHAHPDRLHHRSLELLERRLTLIVPAGTDGADALGFVHVAELEPWQQMRVGAITVTAVPAQHTVGVLGRGLALGYVIQSDGPTVYFAGDTGYQPAFAEIGHRFRPAVALLPIAGYRPLGMRQEHLSPLDALFAREDLGNPLLVPIAHSAFPTGYEPIEEPIDWLREEVALRGLDDRVAILEPGASIVVGQRR